MLAAAVAPVAGLLTAPKRRPAITGAIRPTMPVRDVNDARLAIASQLSTLVAVLVAAADDHPHDRHRAWVGSVPCGDGPAYRMSAIDGIRLEPGRQLAVAAQIRQQLPRYGLIVDTLTPRSEGGVWIVIHTGGYTAAYRSADPDTISVIVASECATSPDGIFPVIG
ncbi:hypothetical protein AB0H43_14035 [Hamadaea sp. NPDC050747]|uniref:hypothetical protein n=1 Tax=Hamadaea sp. NPDC050747 TaxID=3155789 RepID=UPI0033F96C68